MVHPVFGDGWAFDAWCAQTRENMDAYLEASIAGGSTSSFGRPPVHRLILSQDPLFTLICWQCLHHGFGNLHTSQFVGGLFARFAGISLGPDPQGTRQQDTKQHHHKTGRRKKSKPEQKMDSPLELSMKFKSVEFFCFFFRRKVDVPFAGSGK